MTLATLADLPSEAAARFGARVAFHFPASDGLTSIAYVDIDDLSARFARRLAGEIPHGSRVILCGENSIEWVVACFSIIRAGAVLVPLDPGLAPDQFALILSELGARAVLADREVAERFRDFEGPCFPLDDVAAPPPFSDTTDTDAVEVARQPAPDELAVLAYTAGTTGLPKGVQLSHRNLLSNLDGVLGAVDLRPDDSLMVVLPLYHSFALMVGCIAPLATGTLVELERHPRRLAARLREDRPTILLGVPALYESMLRGIRRSAGTGWPGLAFTAGLMLNRWLIRVSGVNAAKVLLRHVHRSLGGRLRFAVSGAAPLSSQTLAEAHVLGVPRVQGYGLTEAGPVVSIQRFSPRRFWLTRYYWKRHGSVGEPIPGILLRIGAGEGGVGELLVGGPSVMLGYDQRETETSDALRGGVLHTGDLARIDDEGTLWIHGRAKLAISTPGGKLTHIERIESAISEADEVQQVVAVERAEPEWHLAVIVYPSAAVGVDGASEAMILERVTAAVKRAAARLRPYERPREVMLVDEPLPVTGVGKLRRGSVSMQPRFDVARWREHVGIAADNGDATPTEPAARGQRQSSGSVSGQDVP